jgi:predicted nucleic acid-binding protein
MTAPVFVDTNVFVYARQASESIKQPLAAAWIESLWRDQLGRTSIQVLNELYVTLLQKIRPALTEEQAWETVQTLLAWDPHPVDADITLRARDIARRYRLSWWDSLIVAAAQAQNCVILLSEDLQDHAVYGSVRVRSPFTLTISESPAVYAPAAVSRHRTPGRPRRVVGA